MKTEHKLYAAIAVVVVLGIAVYMGRKEDAEEQRAHSAAAAPELPEVALEPDEIAKVTKVEIKNKDKGDVVLVQAEPAPAKQDDGDGDAGAKADDDLKYGVWKLAKPLQAEVNQKNVNSMLDNLEKIELREVITKSGDLYDKYELDGDDAVHVVAYQGDEKVFDMWFGKSGGRGQLARVTGTDGVYVAKGYQGYLYTREIKHWRKTEIWTFDDKQVAQVVVDNEHGRLTFDQDGEDWSATFAKRDEGNLSPRAEPIERFDDKKLESMLRAYKTLRATDFAEEGADTGLEDPVRNGGKVTITLTDGSTHTLDVGTKAKNDDRFAQVAGSDELTYVLSSWTAKWAVAKPDEFQKSKDDEAADEDAADEDADDDDDDEDADDEDDEDADDDAAGAGTAQPKAPAPKPKAPAPKPKAPAPKPKAPAPKPAGGTPYDE